MPYSDIVTLRQMRPAYNIKEESLDEWKTFIANDQFNEILHKVVGSVMANDLDKHKSFWIAGTYGTGKSHAGAVIQHLLCDPWDEVSEYVAEEYRKQKYEVLRSQLQELRKQKRLFPVNLYGQQSIAHEEDLSLQMQREIKRALRTAGIEITVRTDFDNYIQHIEDQPTFWEQLIAKNVQLESMAPNVDKLKQRLTDANTDVLEAMRNALREGGFDIRLKSANLGQWLFEVQAALRQKTDFNGLLIVWDEFTEIMTSTIGSRLLVSLQQIAEAMMNIENDSYFLLISHPSALNSLREEEREKTKGRYHYVTYNMEPISAFKIMSKKFCIVDEDLYHSHQQRFFSLHQEILDKFAQGSTSTDETRDNIANLFPLHPATANLATYYAREAGSSSRSVFDFLASDAIRDFLESEIVFAQEQTITADYLWDYVLPYFQTESTKFGAVTERYNSHHLHVEEQGYDYLCVFKGILLLNALNNIANSDSVTPSTENICNLFVGTAIEPNLTEILDWFNDKSIVQRQPNGNFSILFTALPGEEIKKIKDRLKSNTYAFTDQVIKSSDVAHKQFETNLSNVTRPLRFEFYSTLSNESILMNHIETAKKGAMSYETFVAFLVGRTSEEVMRLKDVARRNCSDERYQDIAFVVLEPEMGVREYERFIEYQANAECAQSHGLPQQKDMYEKQAASMISEWVSKMRSNNATLYLRSDSITIAGSKIATTINASVASRIFSKGPESLEVIRAKGSVTYWKKQSVKATVDNVLSYNTKSDILSQCPGQAKHIEYLLQDSVDDNLQWKSDVGSDHPLKLVCDYVDEMLSGRHTNKNQDFNLGDKLIGLTKPPFGLFQTYAPMAMVAFAMRRYVYQDAIYDFNTGSQLNHQHMVDAVVEMFKAWEAGKASNKLRFMFESKEAGGISKGLISAFQLSRFKKDSDTSSLRFVRWAMQQYCAQQGYPLWSLKYCPECTEPMAALVTNIAKVITEPESVKNPALLTDTLNSYNELKMDLGNLLLPNSDNFRKGFVAYLYSEEAVQLEENEVDEAIAYLRSHLQGEVSLWAEIEVHSQLKNWRIAKSKKAEQSEPRVSGVGPDSVVSGGGGTRDVLPSIDPDQLKQKRIQALSRINGSTDLRSVLENMINSESESIINTILKYV